MTTFLKRNLLCFGRNEKGRGRNERRKEIYEGKEKKKWKESGRMRYICEDRGKEEIEKISQAKFLYPLGGKVGLKHLQLSM